MSDPVKKKPYPLGHDFKELLLKTDKKVGEIYENIFKELRAFQETELRACEKYSKEELDKAETKFRAYTGELKKILEDLMKRFQMFKSKLQTKIITLKDRQNLIEYFEEKIEQTKNLTQDMNKTIQDTIKDPELKRRLETIVAKNYDKVEAFINNLHAAIRAGPIGKDESLKTIPTSPKSFKLITSSYMAHIVSYIRSLFPGQSSQTLGAPPSVDMKNLLTITEVKVKEFYNGILRKVKDLQDNELQNCKRYSKAELTKIKSNLQQYADALQKLSEDILQRLKVMKSQIHTKIITHKDFQDLVSYFESKIGETKNLTKCMINNVQATVNDPAFGKKLETLVETSSQKIKHTVNDLYIAIKKNIIRVGQHKSLSDIRGLFPTFRKFKTADEYSTASTLEIDKKETSGTDCKRDSLLGLNKKKLQFFNLSEHFNSRTNYGRANTYRTLKLIKLLYLF